ncbi:Gag-Pol polyprotein [Dictyocoela muelleri]|nr:Gag-Pol polyprotein [Dictyocoela muelleri]
MVDIYSRYAEIDIINDIKSETVCDSFENNWMKRRNPPDKYLTYNSRQFISMNFKRLLNKYNIQQITSAPNNPTGNGIVERVNKEIELVLRLSRGTNLKTLKNNIFRRINCTCNSTLGLSTIEIFTRSPAAPIFALGENPDFCLKKISNFGLEKGSSKTLRNRVFG